MNYFFNKLINSFLTVINFITVYIGYSSKLKKLKKFKLHVHCTVCNKLFNNLII